MKKTPNKSRKSAPERKMDMAEHDSRVKALGMTERATKMAVRILIALVPVILIILWFIKAVK
jgi:hypothetical protein